MSKLTKRIKKIQIEILKLKLMRVALKLASQENGSNPNKTITDGIYSENMIPHMNLYWAAVQLREFIEMQPVGKPIIFTGDQKTKVVDLPHYKSACKAIDDFSLIIKEHQSN